MKFSSMVASRAQLFEMIRRKPMKVFFKSNLGLRHYDAGHKRHLVKISQGLYHRVDNKLDFNA
jgi:hypothetical protein